MRVFQISILIGLVVLGVVMVNREATRLMHVHCRLTILKASDLRVELTISGFEGDALDLRALVPERLIEFRNVHGYDQAGRELRLLEDVGESVTGEIVSRFKQVSIPLPEGSTAVRVSYEASPLGYQEFIPQGWWYQLGTLSSSVAVVNPATCLLLPNDTPCELMIDVDVPDGWSWVERPTARVVVESPDAAWNARLLAGALTAVPSSAIPGVDILTTTTNAKCATTVDTVLGHLRSVLGRDPPFRKVLILPSSEDGLHVKIMGPPTTVVANMSVPEPHALRELIRELVPAWYGRSRFTLERVQEKDSWFCLGLSEFLARVLPEECGFGPKDEIQRLEFAWVREAVLLDVDLDAAAHVQRLLPARQVKACILVHELDRLLIEEGGIRSVLVQWNGHGMPEAPNTEVQRRALEQIREMAQVEGARNVAFVPEWTLRAEEREHDRGERGSKALVIIFTANSRGHLQDCGCKGSKDGGVARRAHAIKELRGQHPHSVLLDLGTAMGIQFGSLVQDELAKSEQDVFLMAMAEMGYDAFSPTTRDFAYGVQFVERAQELGIPVVSANIRRGSHRIAPPHRLIDANGVAVAVIGYSEHINDLFKYEVYERNLRGLHFEPDVDGVISIARTLRANADVVMVVGEMSTHSLRAISAEGLIDVVLNSNADFAQLWHAPGSIGSTVYSVDTQQSRGVNVLKLQLGPTQKVVGYTHDAMRLDQHYPEDARVSALVEEFYGSIAREVGSGRVPLAWDPLTSLPHVGSDICRDCHLEEYYQWANTGHAGALNTLRKNHRDYVPKCVKCHVVAFGQETGYRIESPRNSLAGVGCEVCHGGAGHHATDPTQRTLRVAPPRSVCMDCHDADHSPGFANRIEEAMQEVSH